MGFSYSTHVIKGFELAPEANHWDFYHEEDPMQFFFRSGGVKFSVLNGENSNVFVGLILGSVYCKMTECVSIDVHTFLDWWTLKEDLEKSGFKIKREGTFLVEFAN